MKQQRVSAFRLALVVLGLMILFLTPLIGHAAIFTVNSTADEPDAALNGVCQTAAGACTLRAAVQEANNSAGAADTIVLPAGTFVLTAAGAVNDADGTADLDVGVPGNNPSTITVTGQGEALTIIDGGGADRVFETLANGSSLTISLMTIRNGTVAGNLDGGCIKVGGSTSAVLNDVVITGCTAGAGGGGIDNTGTLTMNIVALTGNTSPGGALNSGAAGVTNWTNGEVSANAGNGINNSGGTMTLTNVTVSGNTTDQNGAGIDNRGAITLQNVTVSNNRSTAADVAVIGGFRNRDDRGGVATVRNTIISGNIPANCGGVIQTQANNIDNGTTCGFGAAAEPLLGPLAFNGGTLRTHALGVGSPAIDTGGDAATGGCPATDARNVARPVNICDKGSFEFRPQAIVVTPASPHNFGTVTSGTAVDQTIALSNGGDGPLAVGAIAGTNLLAAPFTIHLDSCSTTTLARAASCTLAVQFAPTAAAPATDAFNIPSNDPVASDLTFTVSGTGTADLVSNISVADSIAPAGDLQAPFGNIAVGSLSDATITITAGGTAPLVLGTIASADPLAVPFSITNDTCSGQTLAPSQACTLTVRFSPTANTASSDSFDIPNNDPDTPAITLAVTGSGLSAAGNQAPSAPALLTPESGATGLGASVTFTWNAATDPDGDAVTHRLVNCADPSFAGCAPVEVAAAPDLLHYAGMGGFGAGIIMTGFMAGSGLRRSRKMLLLALTLLLSGALFTACSKSDDETTAAPPAPVVMSKTLTGLTPGTYYWKVVADDGKGGQTSSETRSYTVQ